MLPPMGSGQFLTLEHLLTIPPRAHLTQDPRTLMKEEMQVTQTIQEFSLGLERVQGETREKPRS